MPVNIPTTRDEAISQLVAQDVARWGEGERAASESMHRGNYKTFGAALNALAARAEIAEAPEAPALRAAANAALTSADWSGLMQGG